jgi:hypothetical protein
MKKQGSKRKQRSKALPVLGAAGLSLSLAGSASAFPSAPAADLQTKNTTDDHSLTLTEEEIADVSLATFYVFEKEGDGTSPLVQLVGHGGCGGCHGCGCHGCHGCGGCGHGCGCHGCGGWGGCGCVGIGIGCGGISLGWWGGCGGCSGGGYWCWRRGHRVWCRY